MASDKPFTRTAVAVEERSRKAVEEEGGRSQFLSLSHNFGKMLLFLSRSFLSPSKPPLTGF
jgi:hypothetical protein